MNIILTGFMGTGKSVTGRWLANELGLEFLDTDDLVEQKEALKITEIFKTKGEKYFRDCESTIINEIVSEKKNIVLATGGGALINKNNFSALENWGLIICLTAETDVIYSRIKGKTTRPLLKGEDIMSNIKRIIKERQSIYSKAKIKVDTSHKSVQDVTGEIIQYLKNSDREI